MASLTAYDVDKLITKYELLVALSLEGINGNIAPISSASAGYTTLS